MNKIKMIALILGILGIILFSIAIWIQVDYIINPILTYSLLTLIIIALIVLIKKQQLLCGISMIIVGILFLLIKYFYLFGEVGYMTSGAIGIRENFFDSLFKFSIENINTITLLSVFLLIINGVLLIIISIKEAKDKQSNVYPNSGI